MAIFTSMQEGVEKSFSEEDMQRSAVAIALQQHRKDHMEKHPEVPLQIKPLQESQGSGIDGSLNSDLTPHNQSQANMAHQQADNAQYTSNTAGKELLMPMGCACGERIMARFDANPDEKNGSKTTQYSSTDYTSTFSGVFADFTYNSTNTSYK